MSVFRKLGEKVAELRIHRNELLATIEDNPQPEQAPSTHRVGAAPGGGRAHPRSRCERRGAEGHPQAVRSGDPHRGPPLHPAALQNPRGQGATCGWFGYSQPPASRTVECR